MDFALSEELIAVRDLAREFAEKEIAPSAAKDDKEKNFRPDLIKKMGELGFYGTMIPETYGGNGLGFLRPIPFGPRLVDRATRIVETGLCAAQSAGLSSCLRLGVNAVAFVKLTDAPCQSFIVAQLTTIFLELVECVGHISEQIGRERRQGFR